MYGYLWWIIDSEKRNSAAIGNSGNVIYVNVLPRIVIAAAHSFKPAIYDWSILSGNILNRLCWSSEKR